MGAGNYTNAASVLAAKIGYLSGVDSGGVGLYTGGVLKVYLGSNQNTYFNTPYSFSIGTSNAYYKLTVAGSIWSFAQLDGDGRWKMYIADYGNGVNDNIYAMNMHSYGVTTAAVGFGTTAVTGDGGLRFYTRSGSLTEKMRVTDSGDVGIGTTIPLQRLHVEGNIHISGNINAKYQDLAEWVPSDNLSPGTVVVVDPQDGSRVIASTKPYDSAVAGVISAQPGILLGEAAPGKAKVATTGRVRVRVEATTAAIRVGDLLVTSDVPGVAMRSEPLEINGRHFHQPGTIIGKALEPLVSGEGQILILLSLQ